jgi:hypothetical protein
MQASEWIASHLDNLGTPIPHRCPLDRAFLTFAHAVSRKQLIPHVGGKDSSTVSAWTSMKDGTSTDTMLVLIYLYTPRG